ncbi:MAG: hypothetical protein WCP21_07115, partial [Armatimonadota bacterium]
MSGREAIARALMNLPAGIVRWASAPAEQLPRQSTGVDALDDLLDGGWPKGRVCVLADDAAWAKTWSSGRTSLAVATAADATRTGYLVAWVDGDASLDPASLDAAGADLQRVLWVRGPMGVDRTLSATEEILRAGGFEVVIVRPPRGVLRSQDPGWVRLSRAVERGRTTLLVLGGAGPSSAPGAVHVRLQDLHGTWANAPALLLGAGTDVATDAGETRVALVPP